MEQARESVLMGLPLKRVLSEGEESTEVKEKGMERERQLSAQGAWLPAVRVTLLQNRTQGSHLKPLKGAAHVGAKTRETSGTVEKWGTENE